MRLKSPFKDYYDGLQATDLEPEPLYLRRTTEETLPVRLIPSFYYLGETRKVEPALIGFAGRVFPVLKQIEVTGNPAQPDVTTTFCYSYDEYVALAHRLLKKRELENARLDKRNEVYEFFHRIFEERSSKIAIKYFDTYQVPVFLVKSNHNNWSSNNTIVLHPKLKDWNFARIVPPYEAWRDLTMYWGGRAFPNKPIPEISDADMLIAKGFDKWSFKTPPSKKKK